MCFNKLGNAHWGVGGGGVTFSKLLDMSIVYVHAPLSLSLSHQCWLCFSVFFGVCVLLLICFGVKGRGYACVITSVRICDER